MHEALVRRFLSEHVQHIEPIEDRSSGGPDFKCTTPKGVFYVESTVLTIEAVTRKTKLPYLPTSHEVSGYHLLTQLVHAKCKEKAPQCRKRRDAPCLVAVGTLHADASQLCFGDVEVEWMLTSEPKIAVPVDTCDGSPVGPSYQATDLRFAAFLKPVTGESADIGPARESISGLLLCPFGCSPPEVLGVVNSHARRPFDPALLPDIPFATIEQNGNTVTPHWNK